MYTVNRIIKLGKWGYTYTDMPINTTNERGGIEVIIWDSPIVTSPLVVYANLSMSDAKKIALSLGYDLMGAPIAYVSNKRTDDGEACVTYNPKSISPVSVHFINDEDRDAMKAQTANTEKAYKSNPLLGF